MLKREVNLIFSVSTYISTINVYNLTDFQRFCMLKKLSLQSDAIQNVVAQYNLE